MKLLGDYENEFGYLTQWFELEAGEDKFDMFGYFHKGYLMSLVDELTCTTVAATT